MPAPSKKIATQLYAFAGLIDSTQIQSIGKVFTKNSAKVNVYFRGKKQDVLSKHFNDLNIAKAGAREVIIVLREINFEEQINSRYVDGELKLYLAYYGISNADTTLLFHSKSGSKYQRSIANGYEGKFAGLVSQAVFSNFSYFNSYVEKNHLQLPFFHVGTRVLIEPFLTSPVQDTVFYQKGPINWDDFKGQPKSISKFGAAIFPNFSIETAISVDSGYLQAVIKPSIFMVSSLSWVKAESRESYSLAHEQLHFDIAYMTVSKLLEKLKKVEATSLMDLESHIQYEYLLAYQEMNRLQEKYDQETRHGLNRAAQEEWRSKISTALAAISQSP